MSDKLIEVRIVPYFSLYQIQIVTDDGIPEKDIPSLIDENGNVSGVMMIDPGLNNFATMVDNKGNTPIQGWSFKIQKSMVQKKDEFSAF